jgi:hypothetical protein
MYTTCREEFSQPLFVLLVSTVAGPSPYPSGRVHPSCCCAQGCQGMSGNLKETEKKLSPPTLCSLVPQTGLRRRSRVCGEFFSLCLSLLTLTLSFFFPWATRVPDDAPTGEMEKKKTPSGHHHRLSAHGCPAVAVLTPTAEGPRLVTVS